MTCFKKFVDFGMGMASDILGACGEGKAQAIVDAINSAIQGI